MKYIFLLVLLVAKISSAQSDLKFDKRFVESEDKWVAFQKSDDNSYPFGFIYIDSEAGLTLNYEGSFIVSPSGIFVPTKIDSASLKYRLQPNNVMVAHISENRFAELQIDTIPDWLKNYKTDENSIDRLYKWGYMYNGWNECEKALTFLERAERINPTYKGLAVELAYSYNCLEKYDLAEAILEAEIELQPSDAYVSKEYIYTLCKSNKIEKAIQQFELAKLAVTDKQYDAENCFNILQYYYYQKDNASFARWYEELLKYETKNKLLREYADRMKADIEK